MAIVCKMPGPPEREKKKSPLFYRLALCAQAMRANGLSFGEATCNEAIKELKKLGYKEKG